MTDAKKILMYCFILGGGKGCGRGVYVRNSSQEDIVFLFFVFFLNFFHFLCG